MQLLKKFEQSLVGLRQIEKADSIVVAVSGGRDSVVLLNLFLELQYKWHFKLIVGHVNHRLRGKESDEEEQFVVTLANQFHLPVGVSQVDVRAEAVSLKTSIQNAARLLRYRSLEEMRFGYHARWISTAHHADDNSETILAHLFRGSGLEGMQGIHPVRDNIIRPLLSITGDEIQSYAEENKIQWKEDSSNATDHYTRNEIRHKIIPVITGKLNPNLHSTLQHTSAIFQSLNTFIRQHIDSLYAGAAAIDGEALCLAIPTLKNYFDFEQIALIQRAIYNFFGTDGSYPEIRAVQGLLRSQSGKIVLLHNRGKVFRDRESLVFLKSAESRNIPVHFLTGEIVPFDNAILNIRPVERVGCEYTPDPFVEFIDARLTGTVWTLRRWREGDWFIPFGLKGKQKVSDFLVNRKIPRWQKDQIHVLESGNAIVWLCGQRLDDRFKITDATTSILQLKMAEKK